MKHLNTMEGGMLEMPFASPSVVTLVAAPVVAPRVIVEPLPPVEVWIVWLCDGKPPFISEPNLSPSARVAICSTIVCVPLPVAVMLTSPLVELLASAAANVVYSVIVVAPVRRIQ